MKNRIATLILITEDLTSILEALCQELALTWGLSQGAPLRPSYVQLQAVGQWAQNSPVGKCDWNRVHLQMMMFGTWPNCLAV